MSRLRLSCVLFSGYLISLSVIIQVKGAVDNTNLVLEENENNDPVQRISNEETLRVIKAEVRFLLERETPPKLLLDKWTLVEKAKTVMSKACPEAETPLFLLNAMIRLFRLMYIHTRDYNPSGQSFQEKAQYLRIADALNTCSKEAKPMTFKYVTAVAKPSNCLNQTAASGEVRDANGTVTTPASSETKSYCVCQEKLDTVEIIYTKNTAKPDEHFVLHEKEFTLSRDLSYYLPLSNKSSVVSTTKRDLPVETTWKIAAFTHFYCAKYFRSQPADHSAMLTLMESLFNKELLYRWVNPGKHTNEVWRTLFSSFDLEKFTVAIDACLAAAKVVSDYPVWIVRPAIENFDF